MEFFEYLKERGYVYQTTNEVGIKKALNSDKPITFFLGIDPTADSLHIGHFFALMMFRNLQRHGHRGILLIGGATALIGDPSGKSDMRKMLTKADVARNVTELKKLASKFISLAGENPALIVDNSEWINSYNYLDFMRDVGVHFNVNKMLSSEAYTKRLESGGLTFLEMGYMLIQAYDFIHLHQEYNCILEIGGSDQWGNIVAGTELYRKLNFHLEGKTKEECQEIYGLTCPLLMTKDGKKMGKTESGTLWVARDKTTAYAFYQYFYNTDDADTEMLLKLFTDIPSTEIEILCRQDIIAAKKRMAYEVTKLVHGEDEAQKAVDAANSLFGGGTNLEHVPSVEFERVRLEQGVNILDLVVEVGLFASKGEARRMIEQGGLSIDDNKINAIEEVVTVTDKAKKNLLLQRGKKTFLNLRL
ncbi:MAG: tyrosine--tRNA ligase [Deltaproteobacteria bacterium]|jgi:tyrosyl-tRNA synthetase|nr:tyrosine--tRNA ligase [Deltaproteobacteria bacterium]